MPTAVPLGIQSGAIGADAVQGRIRKLFLVVLATPDANNGWRQAALATGMPVAGDQDSATGYYCSQVGADPEAGDSSGRNYVAWADFKQDVFIGTGTTPWIRKDRVSRNFVKYSVPMAQDFEDADGNPSVPVVNSAHDPFVNPLMQELINPLLRIRRARRSADFDYAAAETCQGSINQYDFTIRSINGDITVDAGTAILHSVVADDELWQGAFPQTPYYNVVLEIERKGQYPPDGGDLADVKINDMGVYYLRTANDFTTKVHGWNPIPKPDGSGDQVYPAGHPFAGQKVQVPLTQPVFLNSDGTRCTTMDATTLLTKVRLFTRYPTKDWSSWIV